MRITADLSALSGFPKTPIILLKAVIGLSLHGMMSAFTIQSA